MENKIKITAEIPLYLKEWINAHDISQNALVVLGLRKLYNEERQMKESILLKELKKYFEQQKMPF